MTEESLTAPPAYTPTRGSWWAAFFAARFASWYFLVFTLSAINIWVMLNNFGIVTVDKDWGKVDLVLSEITYLVDIIIIMNQICQATFDRIQMNRLMALEQQLLIMEEKHGEMLETLLARSKNDS